MEQTGILSKSGQHFFAGTWERHGNAIVTGLSLLCILIAWQAGRKEMQGLEITFYVAAYLIGGYQKAAEGLQTLFNERDLDVDLLMVVAAIGAAAIGYWMDGAILIFIFSLSGTLEGYTMEKTNRDIESLMNLSPQQAIVLFEGQEKRVPVSNLQIGDIIIVRPGERIAADGLIREGSSAVDQASITGEYIPAEKVKGDQVFAGTINGQGALEVCVTTLSTESMLANIIHLVQEARNEKPPSQTFVEKFEHVYARIVVIGAIVFMVVPPFLLGWTWQETIYRAMIFLVVASPCALVSSIMPAMLSAISNAARKGVLFKGGKHLQHIGAIKVVAFDKTGTITIGKPAVTDLIPVQGMTENAFLQIVASLETLSEHPVASSIVRLATDRGIKLDRPANLQAVFGTGIYGTLHEVNYTVGKRAILQDILLDGEQEKLVERLEKEGKTVVFVTAETGTPSGHVLTGILATQDSLRPWAGKVVSQLKKMGIKVVLLTGDTEIAAAAIAMQAGIADVYANLLPGEKVEMIRQLEKKHGLVAMIGDGVNDAPALAAATVGMAIGNGGTDVAINAADVILMKDNIENIPFAVQLGRRTRKVIRQNMVFAAAVAVTLVVLNFIGGIVNLPEGVIGHEGSTVLVILSGLRLLK